MVIHFVSGMYIHQMVPKHSRQDTGKKTFDSGQD